MNRKSNTQAQVVRKSNQLIEAKYAGKSPAIEQKLFAIGLTRLEIVNGTPVSSVSARELRVILGAEDDENIYKKLKKAAVSMLSKNRIIVLEKDGEFLAFQTVTSAQYKGQMFTIKFNNELLPYVMDLKGSYTTYMLTEMLKLKSPFSIRLYELFSKERYRIKKNSSITVEYDLSELKFEIGFFTIDQEKLRTEREKGMSWNEIEKKYSDGVNRWNHFKTRVLKKAQDEFKNTDIRFEFEPIKVAHGAVAAVRFDISLAGSGDEKLDEKLIPFIGHNALSEADLIMFSNEADGDYERVFDAITMADSQTHIENYVGWIRKCIKEGWSDDRTEVLHGSKESADRVNSVQAQLDREKAEPNGKFFQDMWQKVLERPDFEIFQAQFDDIQKQYFEMYDLKDKVESYFEWKRNR